MSKDIFLLSCEDARKELLRNRAYCSIHLPNYYDFSQLFLWLGGVDVLSKDVIDIAKKQYNLNYSIFSNKDGQYAWRKLELIHPIIYYSLVNLITKEENRTLIQQKISETTNFIICESLPEIPQEEESQQEAQIDKRYENIEKRSIELALEYQYVFHTDITNCYWSIYTHSISRALHWKDEAKSKRGFDALLGNKIDCHFQAMSNWQTNGIPQWSMLCDMIAEIVLKFADVELSTELAWIGITEYKILRYRDDYRIFVNNPNIWQTIMRKISSVLGDLWFILNTWKTTESSNIILSSIKEDKWYALKIYKNYKKLSREFTWLHAILLKTYELGINHPNAGSINAILNDVINNFDNFEHIKEKENHLAYISILVNIGIKSPKSFPLIAKLITLITKDYDEETRKLIIGKIREKLSLVPNSDLLEIRIHRIVHKDQRAKDQFTSSLCKGIYEDVKLFNNDRYNSQIKFDFVDKKILSESTNDISDEEVLLFIKTQEKSI